MGRIIYTGFINYLEHFFVILHQKLTYIKNLYYRYTCTGPGLSSRFGQLL